MQIYTDLQSEQTLPAVLLQKIQLPDSGISPCFGEEHAFIRTVF